LGDETDSDIHLERGDLLFEPNWSKIRRFRDTGYLIIMIMCLGSAIFLTVWSFVRWNVWMDGPIQPVILILLALIIIYIISFSLLYLLIIQMPFRIYQNGINSTRVSFINGMKKMDQFIPFCDVNHVTFLRCLGIPSNVVIKFEYRLMNIEKKLLVSWEEVDEIDEAKRALHSAYNSQIEEIDYPYIDENNDTN